MAIVFRGEHCVVNMYSTKTRTNPLEEIYNIFDTAAILNRPAAVAVDATSGLAGVAHWINSYFRLKDHHIISKTDPLVVAIREQVAELYAQGRNTVMGDEELEIMVRRYDVERYEHLLKLRQMYEA